MANTDTTPQIGMIVRLLKPLDPNQFIPSLYVLIDTLGTKRECCWLFKIGEYEDKFDLSCIDNDGSIQVPRHDDLHFPSAQITLQERSLRWKYVDMTRIVQVTTKRVAVRQDCDRPHYVETDMLAMIIRRAFSTIHEKMLTTSLLTPAGLSDQPLGAEYWQQIFWLNTFDFEIRSASGKTQNCKPGGLFCIVLDVKHNETNRVYIVSVVPRKKLDQALQAENPQKYNVNIAKEFTFHKDGREEQLVVDFNTCCNVPLTNLEVPPTCSLAHNIRPTSEAQQQINCFASTTVFPKYKLHRKSDKEDPMIVSWVYMRALAVEPNEIYCLPPFPPVKYQLGRQDSRAQRTVVQNSDQDWLRRRRNHHQACLECDADNARRTET